MTVGTWRRATDAPEPAGLGTQALQHELCFDLGAPLSATPRIAGGPRTSAPASIWVGGPCAACASVPC